MNNSKHDAQPAACYQSTKFVCKQQFQNFKISNFKNFKFSWRNTVQKWIVYTMKKRFKQAAGLCWLSFWLILFNGTAIRLNQISAARFSKIFDEDFFGQIFETGRRGLRIIRWRHHQTSSSYCCHKSIMSPFFLSRSLYFHRLPNSPIRLRV